MTDAPASPTVSPCLTRCRELYEAITARTLGKQVQSVGHKGRSLGYTGESVDKMIGLYMQIRAQCPEAQAELPVLNKLDQPNIGSGPPARYRGRGYV